MTFSHAEAMASTLEYFGGDELAADAFVKKYALQNPDGAYLERNPEDMHRRLAREFARVEARYANPMSEDEIFALFDRYRYVVPQGSPMSAIGNPFQIQSLSNCFVIDSPHDSYGGIFMFDQEEAQIMKRRGGVGGDVSPIRPKGMVTSNAAKTTDGLGVFMQRFSNTCREVAQDGRRGALMLTCNVHHPEIDTFINIKRDRKKVTGANISIRITDEFMRAVRDDTEYQQRWPVDAVMAPKVSRMVRARDVWDRIISAAHECAEPGLLFWDRVTELTPADAYASRGYATISTNPCGELPLCAYDSCRLMLVNLISFVSNPYTPEASFDWKTYMIVVEKAQRLMDDLVDLELEAVEKILAKIEADDEPAAVKRVELELWNKIKEKASGARRTGLGITGLGDCLAALGIKYGAPDSITLTEEIYKNLAVASYRSSCTMAGERGAFPAFDRKLEKDHPFINKVLDAGGPELRQLYALHGRRNMANTTTAPAGTVSTQTQSTSGIEPAIFISYTRKRKVNASEKDSRVDEVDEMGDRWQKYSVHHHGFKRWMDVTGLTDPQLSPYWKATAEEIDWVASVDLQAAAQRWVCHAISKTCNLPADVSVDSVKQVYMRAWEAGCKGFTVYRKGSRDAVMIDENEAAKKRPAKGDNRWAPKRPKELDCELHHVKVRAKDEDDKNWLVVVSQHNGTPYEVFCGLAEHVEVPRKCKRGKLIKNGKKDGIATYNLKFETGGELHVYKDIVNLFDNPTHGAFTRTLSLALRHGIPIQYIVEQLQKDKHSDMWSFSRVIARVLKGYIPDGTKPAGSCPGCGNVDGLAYVEGCVTCQQCGYSKCS